MFYKLLIKPNLETFEKAATELIRHEYEPVGGVVVNTLITGVNNLTGQQEAMQVFTQGFIGEVEIQDISNERNSSPLIIA